MATAPLLFKEKIKKIREICFVMIAYLYMVGCILLGCIGLAFLISFLPKIFVSERKRVGNQGEDFAERKIKSILREEDILFRNLSFKFDGKRAELDFVIINPFGVFIIETKNYYGYLVGNEEDYEWKKYKKTRGGNIYEKEVKNPLKQVKRQVYLLAQYLKECGVKVWVDGYAYMVNGNTPESIQTLLLSERDVDRVIHTNNGRKLSKETIQNVVRILNQL